MKMLAEYVETALNLERMATVERDAKLKANLEKLAAAYRRLAAEKGAGLKPPEPAKHSN
jgi:hypothetical protein